MIKLNNKLYSKLSYQVSFGDYQVKQNGKKRSGKAPYITFILDDFEYFLKFFKSSIEVLFHFMTISQSPLLILQ